MTYFCTPRPIIKSNEPVPLNRSLFGRPQVNEEEGDQKYTENFTQKQASSPGSVLQKVKDKPNSKREPRMDRPTRTQENRYVFHSLGFTDTKTGDMYIKTPHGFLKPITGEELAVRRRSAAARLLKIGHECNEKKASEFLKKWCCIAACHIALRCGALSQNRRVVFEKTCRQGDKFYAVLCQNKINHNRQHDYS